MSCIKNCNACSIGQQKEPNSSPRQHLTTCCTTNASEVEWIGLWCFASSIIFTWPLVNQLSLFQASWKLFAGKTLPQPAGGRKCFLRVWPILKHRFLHYRNKQTSSSLAKTCWLYWFIFWLIKMCLSLVTWFKICDPKPQLHLHLHQPIQIRTMFDAVHFHHVDIPFLKQWIK